MNNLPRDAPESAAARSRTRDLLIASSASCATEPHAGGEEALIGGTKILVSNARLADDKNKFRQSTNQSINQSINHLFVSDQWSISKKKKTDKK